MTDILFSDNNKHEIDSYLSNPIQAVLLWGPAGYGKYFVAKYIAYRLLGLDSEAQLIKYPYFSTIKPENKVISIDKIRDLKKLFLLRTTGKNKIRRVVLIENSHLMNDEAQNALLKILEEPPEDSVIILTASNKNRLNQTILSRVQPVKISRPNLNKLMAFFNKKGYSESEIEKNYLFSNGSIGLIHSLLSSEEDNEYIEYINSSKQLLSSTMVEKLMLIDSLSKSKETLDARLYTLKQITKAALLKSLVNEDRKKIMQWTRILKSIQQSEDNLALGANPKLLLTNLILNL